MTPVAQAIMLRLLPIIGGCLLTYATIASPEAWWLRVLSVLPPLAPILMPARPALGTVAGWEMAVAVLLTLGGVCGKNSI